MIAEKSTTSLSGYLGLLVLLIAVGGSWLSISYGLVLLTVFCILTGILSLAGLIIINPNESKALTLFGKYIGTVKTDGFYWVNPFTVKKRVSLKARNLNGHKMKVNDKLGNPIEIAAVVVWKISDTAKALFSVDNYTQYVEVQSEAAVRHLANLFAYDSFDEDEPTITLKDGAEDVSQMLELELKVRLALAGIEVIEARITHLAYAPEIAAAMLQRQQATAVVAARKQLVEGAVGMVEMALERLSEKDIVQLDEERKAAMVSNLLVVLCGDKNVAPVVNAGTLYH